MNQSGDDSASALASRYLDILSTTDLGEIFREPHRYSGVFLAGLPHGFDGSNLRILIVGKEPKAWRDGTCRFRAGEQPSLVAVLEAMESQRAYLARRAGSVKFIQFVKQVVKAASRTRVHARVSVHWGNLFCVSHAAGSPVKSRGIESVAALSARLLRAQIAVVEPDIIFFTTGHSYDAFLHSAFPDRFASNPIQPKCLWEFRVGRALCYRTSHPRYAAHNGWREEAIRLAFASEALACVGHRVE
ncbi:uracil-DNA glycosylase family protein [Paraburkholderia sp. SIMBA_054]|uniref:uracil-DNA glycosylase family protein n=1 Tax=Paraburkholderia sp. SIMBA_054 TaxID=3085795 RepID=UPI00397B3B1C